MKKAKAMVGLPIIILNTGEELYKVVDILFSQSKRKVLGFLLDEGGWFKGAKVLLLKDVYKIGKDALIIQNKEKVLCSTQIPEVEKILEDEYHIFELEVMDDEGNNVGIIENVSFNEENGQLDLLEISGGIFEDILNGRLNIPIAQDLKLEQERVIVSSKYIKDLQKSGGLKKYFSEDENKRGSRI